MSKLGIPLVVTTLLLLAAAPGIEAQHNLGWKANGVAVRGSEVYVATLTFQSFGTLPVVYGNFRLTLTNALGGVVLDKTFYGSITQTGLDNDPIPEMYVRTLQDLAPDVAFTATGGMVQWEQTPNVWVHAYSGTYNDFQVHVVVTKVHNTFL